MKGGKLRKWKIIHFRNRLREIIQQYSLFVTAAYFAKGTFEEQTLLLICTSLQADL